MSMTEKELEAQRREAHVRAALQLVPDGCARFMARYHASLRKRAHDLVQEWDRVFGDYVRALPALGRDQSYLRALDELRELGRRLRKQPVLVAALCEPWAEEKFKLAADRPHLKVVLDCPDPAELLERIVQDAEGRVLAARQAHSSDPNSNARPQLQRESGVEHSRT